MHNKIRHFRKQRGFTLAALGAAIGLTPQSVSRIENEKMRLSTDWMERIAAALNVSPVDLIETGAQGGAELIGEISADGACAVFQHQVHIHRLEFGEGVDAGQFEQSGMGEAEGGAVCRCNGWGAVTSGALF